jgi:hypothetical protein
MTASFYSLLKSVFIIMNPVIVTATASRTQSSERSGSQEQPSGVIRMRKGNSSSATSKKGLHSGYKAVGSTKHNVATPRGTQQEKRLRGVHTIFLDLTTEPNSSVGIATGCGLDGTGSVLGRGNRLLGSPSLVSNGYRGIFPRG